MGFSYICHVSIVVNKIKTIEMKTLKTLKKILLTGLFGFITTMSMANQTGSIYNNQQEIMTFEVKDQTCHNNNDGSIEINIVDGNNYFFSWDNGMNTKDLYNLSKGIFRVKIETPQGGIIWASFTVDSPDQLQGMIIQDNFNGIVNLDLIIQGGTSPYNYSWSNSQTTEDLYGITEEGIYEVNITDDNGCLLNLGTYVVNEQTSSITENTISSTSEKIVYDLSGKQVVLENSPSGIYIVLENNKTTKIMK